VKKVANRSRQIKFALIPVKSSPSFPETNPAALDRTRKKRQAKITQVRETLQALGQV
jgi:vacuolar-type H+-ATPase subunit I/STV1